jgi:uncharacterized protein YkwD
LELINRERAAAGLPALTLDDEVSGIAAGWSRRMAAAGGLSHNGDYLSQDSLRRLDASTVGENVAYADTVDEIHSLYMQSPPHRHNILSPDYREVGIAAVRTGDGLIYLTEDFLTRRSTSGAEPAGPAAAAEHRPPPTRRSTFSPGTPARPADRGGRPRPRQTPRPAAAPRTGPAKPASAAPVQASVTSPTASEAAAPVEDSAIPTTQSASAVDAPPVTAAPPPGEAAAPAVTDPPPAGGPPVAANAVAAPAPSSSGTLWRGAPLLGLALLRRRGGRRR